MKKIHEDIFALIKKMKDINLVFLLLLMTILFIPINIIVFYGMTVVLIFIFSYQLYLINTKISELTLSITELTVNYKKSNTFIKPNNNKSNIMISAKEENVKINKK